MTFTVLLTCVGGELAPLMIKMLQTSVRHRVRVVGTDMREDAAGRYFADLFFTVPAGNKAGYVEALLEIVKTNAVNLIIPTADEEALALSARRSEFSALGCVLACAEHNTLRILADKADAYHHMRQAGLPIPDWIRAETSEELGAAVEKMLGTYNDVVVKPVSARGGRDVCIVTNSGGVAPAGARESRIPSSKFFGDVLPAYGAALPAMVMPRLEEPVHDLDMLAWRGEPIRVVPRRRVSSTMPNEGHVILDAPKLIDLGERIIALFDLSWLYDCDIMFDAEGQPFILEINPRQSGSIAASVIAGVPLLDDVLSLAKGEPVPPVALPAGRIVVPFKSLGLRT
jgi:carbamoyl-phosphate synthase large subunit